MVQKVVVLAADYQYINNIETTIKSLFYHNDNTRVYIINYDIPQEWFINIRHYLNRGNQLIDRKINYEIIRNEHSSFNHINNMAFARFLIPELVNENKVLYLDSDTLVINSLDELFVQYNPLCLAACREPHVNNDYNSGVLLLNNKFFRENRNVVSELLEKGTNPELINGDQQVINEFFKNRITDLPKEYNFMVGLDWYFFYEPTPKSNEYFQVTSDLSHAKIIHYISADKPWNLTSVNRFRSLWWSYACLNWENVANQSGKHAIRIPSKKSAFMFTKSEYVEGLEKIVTKCPNVDFHICAWTGMGTNLTKLSEFDNVYLHPKVIGPKVDSLIANADVYLDINYSGKEINIIEKFAKLGKPVLEFSDTVTEFKNNNSKIIVQKNDIDKMIELINN